MIEVSIVIPSRNSQRTIEKTIASIFANDYPKSKYEVIVVDSSEDASYLEKFKIRLIKIKPTKERIANLQRNVGAKAARGRFVLYTDSDCIVPRNWIKTIVKNFADGDIAVVGGGVTTKGNLYDTYMQNAIKPATRSFEETEVTTKDNFHKRMWPLGANQAYRKEVLEKVGYFNEKIQFYEEVDVLWRIVSRGYKVVSVPGITVKHSYNKNFLGVMKTYFRYGRGCGYFCMRYPTSKFAARRISLLLAILIFYASIILELTKFPVFILINLIPLAAFILYYSSIFSKIGLISSLFSIFDIFFPGMSFIAGMLASIFLFPFNREWKFQ